MLESFREGRVAPLFPLLMALGCQPGSVSPDVQSDIDSIIIGGQISVDDILAQCNERVPLTGRPWWSIRYQEPVPPYANFGVVCDDSDENGSADKMEASLY